MELVSGWVVGFGWLVGCREKEREREMSHFYLLCFLPLFLFSSSSFPLFFLFSLFFYLSFVLLFFFSSTPSLSLLIAGLRFECLTNGDVDVPLIYRPLLHGNSSDSGDTFDESYGAAMVPVNVTIAGFNGLKSVVLQYNKKCGGHKKGLKVWVPSSHLYVPLLHWCTVV